MIAFRSICVLCSLSASSHMYSHMPWVAHCKIHAPMLQDGRSRIGTRLPRSAVCSRVASSTILYSLAWRRHQRDWGIPLRLVSSRGVESPALSEHLRPPLVLSPPTSGLRSATQRVHAARARRPAVPNNCVHAVSKPAVAHHALHGTRHRWCSVGDERSKAAWAVAES